MKGVVRCPLSVVRGSVPPCSSRTTDNRQRTTLLALLLLFCATSALALDPPHAAFQQRLNTRLPMDVMVRGEDGSVKKLGDYFGHGKPVVIQFLYYRCPMLCSIVGDGLVRSLTELKFNVGKEFDVLSISIDPRDMPEAATRKKDEYVKHYGRLDAAYGWHFLTGHETAIKRIADAAGFQYTYDPSQDQFAHAAGIVIATPEGRLSRYLYGFEYKPRDLRLALAEASQGKIGGPAEQFLLLCYHYDPATGKYSRSAMTFVRAGGVASALALFAFIFVMVRTDNAKK